MPALNPLPAAAFTVVRDDRRHELPWIEYFTALDKMLRTAQTVALAVPSNANAALAGVPIGGLYTDTADPAQIFMRTV